MESARIITAVAVLILAIGIAVALIGVVVLSLKGAPSQERHAILRALTHPIYALSEAIRAVRGAVGGTTDTVAHGPQPIRETMHSQIAGFVDGN